MPTDRRAFVRALYLALGGTIERAEGDASGHWETEGRRERLEMNRQLADLAGKALVYFQIEEGLGHPPSLDEFGRSWFAARRQALNTDVGRAWEAYVQTLALTWRDPQDIVEQVSPITVVPTPTPPLAASPVESPQVQDVEPRASWWRRIIGAVRN